MSKFVAFLLALVLAWPAQAQQPPEALTAAAEVESVAAKRPFWIAVRITPQEGDVIPWFDPETGGRAVYLSLDGAGGFSPGELILPPPGISGGAPRWQGAVWLLQEVLTPARLPNAADYRIAGEVAWSECEDFECRERRRAFSLTLPAGRGEADPRAAPLFASLRQAAPRLLPWPVSFAAGEQDFTLAIEAGAQAGGIADARFLSARARAGGFLSQPVVMERENGRLVLELQPPGGFMAPGTIEGLVYAESAGGGRTVYALQAPNSAAAGEGVSLTSSGFRGLTVWLALGFAFLGGLLLNLMPCVFPVLTLKVFGLVKSAARSRAAFALDGIAYTAGILVSFAIVALALLTFRAAGEQVGWGFQLQSPAFVTALSLVMFLVTLNFAGLYEIRVPFALEPGRKGEGVAGAFYTGVLATVLATPCTAPFMAPALGFALTLPTLAALGVFLGLGLGLAFPYLLVSLVPKAQKLFPKPGRWMATFRRVLAVPLAATLGWLLWVLHRQAGWEAVGAAALYMALLLGLIVLYKKSRGLKPAARGAALGLAVVIAGGLAHFAWPALEAAPARESDYPGEVVEFSPDRVWALRLQGRGVFVNFTADWCLTCLVNERLVFKNPKFQRFLEANGIVYMEADWTSPDPEIAAALDNLGRSALPVYAFYPPGGPSKEVVLLPEVLTLEGAIERIAARLN